MEIVATGDINVTSLMMRDRIIPPTPQLIDRMAKSLKDVGQISPILVKQITNDHFKVICGATRFKAASKLGWQTIQARIAVASDDEFKVLEIEENLERSDLTAEQRVTLKKMRDELLAEKIKLVGKHRGGRGRKGGISEAARQVGVPRTTAHYAVKRAKPVENPGSRQVSPKRQTKQDVSESSRKAGSRSNVVSMFPRTPSQEAKKRADASLYGKMELVKLSITWSVREDQRFMRWRELNGYAGNRSRAARYIVNSFLDRELKEEANG